MKLFKEKVAGGTKAFEDLLLLRINALEGEIEALTDFVKGKFGIWPFAKKDGLTQRVERIEALVREERVKNIEKLLGDIMQALIANNLVSYQEQPSKPDFVYGDKPVVIRKKGK